ncbi:hypothetical protein BH09VER1_BH09VER1_37870 [soil metagenome]
MSDEPVYSSKSVDPVSDSLFQAAIARIDQANSLDPNSIPFNGTSHPAELLYSQRLTAWVKKLSPSASQALLLAAHSQHICRWHFPRTTYPEGRAGYLKWRADLKLFHASTTANILSELGFPTEFITRVQQLNLKKELGRDPEMQVLEDALCLMTLQYQFADLLQKTPRDKLIAILQKTWRKMSEAGHAAALSLDYPPDQLALIQEALTS